MKKKICILYTGGTIGMVATEYGYAPKKNYISDVLSQIPDLGHEDMPLWDVVEFDPLLDSSNMAVDQWVEIGKAIEELFNVKVKSVNVMNYEGKAKRAGRTNKMGRRADWKKAIVTLAEGSIEII
jgi:L-asparaginase/Glu-tRNA(Gln) amidotransferase subunit D